jgi:hypothetical protein
MAVITSSITTVGSPDGVPSVRWVNIGDADTCTPFIMRQQYGLAASVQVVGTFGGATMTIQVSNDGTNWVTAQGVDNTGITFTSTGYREFSLSAAYVRPLISGGAGSNLSVIMVLRGSSGL